MASEELRHEANLRDPLYVGHWEGLAAGELRLRRCVNCGAWQWPPRDLCGTCQHAEFEWVAVPAKGTAYTFTVMYRAFHPGFADRLPYGLAVADLAEGVRYLAVYDGNPEELECGSALVGAFRAHGHTPELVWRASHE